VDSTEPAFSVVRAGEFRRLLNINERDFAILRERDPQFPKGRPLLAGMHEVWLREQAYEYARILRDRVSSSVGL
jgi:hypothetical protein